ncbi:MAG: helix-turn-helix domain-containing protein [Reyranellaceae bacterium]
MRWKRSSSPTWSRASRKLLPSQGEKLVHRGNSRSRPSTKDVRKRVGLSQSEFARLIHVGVRTLQNWEQNRCSPTGPAVALLKIVATAPEVALKSLHR